MHLFVCIRTFAYRFSSLFEINKTRFLFMRFYLLFSLGWCFWSVFTLVFFFLLECLGIRSISFLITSFLTYDMSYFRYMLIAHIISLRISRSFFCGVSYFCACLLIDFYSLYWNVFILLIDCVSGLYKVSFVLLLYASLFSSLWSLCLTFKCSCARVSVSTVGAIRFLCL